MSDCANTFSNADFRRGPGAVSIPDRSTTYSLYRLGVINIWHSSGLCSGLCSGLAAANSSSVRRASSFARLATECVRSQACT